MRLSSETRLALANGHVPSAHNNDALAGAGRSEQFRRAKWQQTHDA